MMNIPSVLKLIVAIFFLATLPVQVHALTPDQVFDKVKDSIIVVKTLDAQGKVKSQGSGMLLPSGKTATNCHVVEGGASYLVGRSKQFVPATLSSKEPPYPSRFNILSGRVNVQAILTESWTTPLEAKMFSILSSGVKHASYFDQAARNVACMTEVLSMPPKRSPSEFTSLGFYVLAPKSQIDRGTFKKDLNRDSIREKVERRVKKYEGEKDEWFLKYFIPTLDCMKIEARSWEELIDTIRIYDPNTIHELEEFYKLCLQYNQKEEINFG